MENVSIFKLPLGRRCFSRYQMGDIYPYGDHMYSRKCTNINKYDLAFLQYTKLKLLVQY